MLWLYSMILFCYSMYSNKQRRAYKALDAVCFGIKIVYRFDLLLIVLHLFVSLDVVSCTFYLANT